MVSEAHKTAHSGRCHAMPGHKKCVLTISFNCFSRLSAKWPCPWPDCAVAAILRSGKVDIAVVSNKAGLRRTVYVDKKEKENERLDY